MQDAVKIIADGIRVDKKLLKTGAQGKRQSRREISSDATRVGKDADASIIVNATANSDNSAEAPETKEEKNTSTETNTADNSANRTDDTKKESEN